MHALLESMIHSKSLKSNFTHAFIKKDRQTRQKEKKDDYDFATGMKYGGT